MGVKEQITEQLKQLALQQNALTQQLKNIEESMKQLNFASQVLEQSEKERAEKEAAAKPAEVPEPTE